MVFPSGLIVGARLPGPNVESLPGKIYGNKLVNVVTSLNVTSVPAALISNENPATEIKSRGPGPVLVKVTSKEPDVPGAAEFGAMSNKRPASAGAVADKRQNTAANSMAWCLNEENQ